MKNLGAGRLAAMLMTFFGLIIFFVFIAVRSNTPSLTMLYGGLSVTDSTEIAAKLDAVNIPYRMNEDGHQISVPQKDVGKARILLAQEGLPRQGSVGYEIFDQKQSFGATSFQQNINALRALEGELARTIGSIEQVKSARVHLVLPQRELFSREQQAASASVFLNLRNAAAIGQEQIMAMQHLVAASVPQLKAGSVAIIDQNGNLLAKGEEDQSGAGGSAGAGTADELKRKFEMRLSRSVEDMVGRVVGFGRVRANVSADLNFDVVSRNSESFNPDGQVVRSTQSTTEDSSDNSGASSGSVSVQNNLPGLPATGSAAGGSGGNKNTRTEETTNYEISKTVENLVRESGQVQKLSIAVLVDGRYETDKDAKKPDKVKDDEWQPPRKYVPRTQDELDKITALVKTATGFDESRGDSMQVVNMQFAEGETPDIPLKDDSKIMGFSKGDILSVAETISLSVVAVLVILLVLRPLATHIASSSRGRNEMLPSAQEEAALLASQVAQGQLTAPGGGAMQASAPSELDSMIDMSSVEGKVKASSVQKISELVTNHPNEAVSVIRQWMSQES
jgi:flagellar M-ring protein FliF